MLRAMNAILLCVAAIPALSQTATIAEKVGRPILLDVAQSSCRSPTGVATPAQSPRKSTEVIGLADTKNKTDGTLTIEDSKLYFAHAEAKSGIAASAMEDVVTGNDSQRVIRGTLGFFRTSWNGTTANMWRCARQRF